MIESCSVEVSDFKDSAVDVEGFVFIKHALKKAQLESLRKLIAPCRVVRQIAGDVKEYVYFLKDGTVAWRGWNAVRDTVINPLLRRIGLHGMPIIQATRLVTMAPPGGTPASTFWCHGEQPWHQDFLLCQGRVILLFLDSCYESTHFVDTDSSQYRRELRNVFSTFYRQHRCPTPAEVAKIVKTVFSDQTLIPMRDAPAVWRDCCEGTSLSDSLLGDLCVFDPSLFHRGGRTSDYRDVFFIHVGYLTPGPLHHFTVLFRSKTGCHIYKLCDAILL